MKHTLMRLSDHGCGCPVWTLHGMENNVFWCRNCPIPFWGASTDKMDIFKELIQASPEALLSLPRSTPQ